MPTKTCGRTCCPSCGCELEITETEEGSLGCIEFLGPEALLLAGYVKTRNGAIMFVGPDGTAYSRTEAVTKFGLSEVEHQERKAAAADRTVIKLGKW
jgi:hypothetical protein